MTMLRTTKEQRAIWYKASDSDKQALLSDLEEVIGERDDLQKGKCLETIPGTLIMCGESGHYCSLACHLRSIAPKPCLPDVNLYNVEEAAAEAGRAKGVYIANETIAGMAREIREWRAFWKEAGSRK